MNKTVALDSRAELLEDRPISPIEHDRVAAAAAAHDALAAGVPLLVVAGGAAAARAALGRALRLDRLAAGEDVLALRVAAGHGPGAGVAAHLDLQNPADDAALAAALAVYAAAQTRLVILLHDAEHLDEDGLAELRRLRHADPAAVALSVVLLGDDTVARIADRLLRPSPPGGLRFIRLTPLALAPAAPIASLPPAPAFEPGRATRGAPAEAWPQDVAPAAVRPSWTPTPVASAPYGQDAPAWPVTFATMPAPAALWPATVAAAGGAIPSAAASAGAGSGTDSPPAPASPAAAGQAEPPYAAPPGPPLGLPPGIPPGIPHWHGDQDLPAAAAWHENVASPAAADPDEAAARYRDASDPDASDPDAWEPGHDLGARSTGWDSVHEDAPQPEPEPPAFAWPDAAPESDRRGDPWPAAANDRPDPADDRAAEPGFQRSAAAPEADHPAHADDYQDAFAQLAARDAAEPPRAPAMSLLRRSEIIPPVPLASREAALTDRARHRPRILLPLAGIAVLAAMVGWFVVQALTGTAPLAPPGARLATVTPPPAPLPAAPGATGATPAQTAAAPNPPAAGSASGSPAPASQAPTPPPAAPATGSQPAPPPPPDAARAPERSAAAAAAPAAGPRPAEAPPAAAPETPSQAAAPPVPAQAATQAAPPPSAGPGLLVIAKADDTLRSLYARVYKGLTAPAFETVAAMNPHDIKLGDVVVFPGPPGGWKRPPNTAGR